MSTVIRFKTLDGKDFTFPKEIYHIMKEGLNRVNQKLDCPIIITGTVGAGKSNLGFGIGGLWNEIFLKRPFTLDNIHFLAEDVTRETNRDDNYKEFIGFDEAIQGGSSRDGITKIGNILRKTYITKRYKGHCIVACVDSLKELNDKIIERSMCWFHVHYHRRKSGMYRKGIIKIFSTQQALKVWEDLKLKKVTRTEDHYLWIQNNINVKCMNYENVWFSEKEYNDKKTKATDLLEEQESDNKIMNQRDILIVDMIQGGKTHSYVANLIDISKQRVGVIWNKWNSKQQLQSN